VNRYRERCGIYRYSEKQSVIFGLHSEWLPDDKLLTRGRVSKDHGSDRAGEQQPFSPA